MPNPETTTNFQSAKSETSGTEHKVPGYGVEEYLERASNFYYKQDKPKDEAGYLTLLQDINTHKNKGADWRQDEHLVSRVERFIKERFENFITGKQAVGDEEAVQYYQERLNVLLEDLHSESNP